MIEKALFVHGGNNTGMHIEQLLRELFKDDALVVRSTDIEFVDAQLGLDKKPQLIIFASDVSVEQVEEIKRKILFPSYFVYIGTDAGASEFVETVPILEKWNPEKCLQYLTTAKNKMSRG